MSVLSPVALEFQSREGERLGGPSDPQTLSCEPDPSLLALAEVFTSWATGWWAGAPYLITGIAPTADPMYLPGSISSSQGV